MAILLDWGDRSERLRVLHANLRGSKSFLLTKAPTPVSLGGLDASQLANWDAATVTPIPVTPVNQTFTANATLPPGTTFVRLDFDLKVTIGGTTVSCLEFRQLFTVGAGDVLSPSQYSFEDHLFKTAGSAGAAPVAVSGANRRILLGSCPLLKVATAGVTINCEFLDVTELWWATWAAADQWGWLLDPDFHGHPELIRVLAWTSGCAPMLWFIALSDKAIDGAPTSPRSGADVIILRAQAGFNTFRYSSDEAGFLNSKHGDTTMFHLGRWLLSPLSESETAAKITKTGNAPKPLGVGHAGVRLRPEALPPGIDPKDPLDVIAKNVRWAFRPAGVHDALLRSVSADIAFFPLGFDGGGKSDPYTTGGGYTALLKSGALRNVIDSARFLLWMRGSLYRSRTATPPKFYRQIWLAANSAANRQLFGCLNANNAEIERIVSMDATPAADVLIPTGVPAIQNAADKQRKTGGKFKAVFVTTPNMWTDKTAYLDIERKLRSTKADVEMLPPNAEFDSYWQHPPTASSNPLMFEALKFWDGNGLAASKRLGTQKGDQWLWWHEWSVNGGHFDTTPPGQTGPSTAPQIRSFFEDALKM